MRELARGTTRARTHIDENCSAKFRTGVGGFARISSCLLSLPFTVIPTFEIAALKCLHLPLFPN